MKGQRPEHMEGTVSRATVRRGSAGEYSAPVLTTDDGEQLILQRIGSNPYQDAAADALIGCRVSVEGHRLNRVFRYLRAEVIEPSAHE